MKLMQWTLFLDLLGYRDKNGSISNRESAEAFVAFMKKNKTVFTDTNAAMPQKYEGEAFDLYHYYDFRFAFVSDSLILTLEPKEVDIELPEKIATMHSANALFIIVMRLQAFIANCFMSHQLFARGGISNKYCYILDEFAVGEGLIEAYELESKHAINPRIILSKDISENNELMSELRSISKKMYQGRHLVNRDSDGWFFVDYLSMNMGAVEALGARAKLSMADKLMEHNMNSSFLGFIKSHAVAIQAKLAEIDFKISSASDAKVKDGLLRVKEKYLWLKTYHNQKIHGNPPYNKHPIK